MSAALNCMAETSRAVNVRDTNLCDPAEGRQQAAILRCIFGDPFRPTAIDASWLTADVVGLARTIYDERAFDRLPLLASFLEAAGCTDAEILGHCRSKSDHARGCWVVDLVLGRA